MPPTGLGASYAFRKKFMKGEPCERCTLYYEHNKHVRCPHCGDLDDAAVRRLRHRLEQRKRAAIPLGYLFLLLAGVLLMLMAILAS